MNIVFVIGSLRAGGAERQVRYLARSLSTLGDQITIAVIERGHHPKAIGSAPVVELRSGADSWIRAMTRLRTLARGADVVYSWMDIANAIAALASLRLSVPVVWGFRTSGIADGTIPRLGFWLSRLLSFRAALAVCNSVAVEDFYRSAGFSPRCWRVIANGVDTDRFAPGAVDLQLQRTEYSVTDDETVVGMIARADGLKRHDLFFAMVRLLAERFPRVRWVVAGMGAHASNAEFRALMDRYEMVDRLLALGEVSDVPALVASLDIVVCCSDTEGSSNSILEALSCGVPVVSFPVGDAESMLGNCGLIVHERTAAALAGAVAELLDDPQRRRSLGEAGRELAASQYSVETLALRTRAALSDALGKPH